MNKGTEDKLVPKLRFPEFKNDGDWRIEKLGDVFSERKEIGFLKLPLLSLTDKDGIIPQEQTNRKNNSSLDKSKYLRICPGDIAYNTMRMWEGRSAYVNIEGLVSPAYTVCKPSPSNDGLFFSYYFKTPKLISQFHRYSQGLVKDTLNLKYEAFSRILASRPQKKEQQKIADCLSSLDDLITAENQKLNALKNHKKGLMQQMFPAEGEKIPKLRFSEFKNSGDWEETKLGEVCISIASGKDKLELEGALDLYGSTGIIGKTNSNSFTGDFILVARVGANAGMLNKVHGTFGVTDNTLVLSLQKDQQLNFVYYLLDNFGLNKLIFGSGQPLVTGGQLKNLLFTFPNFLEQGKIADCLSALDEQIDKQIQKVECLKSHKKSLMQQLFPTIN